MSSMKAYGAGHKKGTFLFLITGLVFLLTACGWQGTGTVTGKSHHEDYWYSTTICGAYDAKGSCTFYSQQMNYVPDYWYVDVRDDSGETHAVSVNEEYWNGVKDGDHFDNRDEK